MRTEAPSTVSVTVSGQPFGSKVVVTSWLAGVPLRIIESPSAGAVAAGSIAHVFLAENGAPLRKLESFKTALGEGARVDVALMKFCYVDVNGDTDAKALFERYRATITELRAKNPRTTFVHVTLPLTTAQTGWKALAKRMLGRAPYGTVENPFEPPIRRRPLRDCAGSSRTVRKFHFPVAYGTAQAVS